jgi:hypothetical protein
MKGRIYHGDTENTEKDLKMIKRKKQRVLEVLRDLRGSVVKEISGGLKC